MWHNYISTSTEYAISLFLIPFFKSPFGVRAGRQGQNICSVKSLVLISAYGREDTALFIVA